MDIANSIVTLLVAVLVVLLLGVFLGATGMYYWLDSRSKMASSGSKCAFVSQKKKGKISYNESEVLGRGLSKVYKGMFEDRIPVAVKIIEILDKEQTSEFSKSLNSIDQSLWPRQQREININQSQTEMGHPNLVRYFGYEVIENGKTIILLALELCQCTLEDFIYKRKDFPALSNRDIFQQIANGLDHLHSRNIAHRDLKPSNVMIKTDFKSTHQVKIADFGLSKFLPDDTSESALSSTCGTKGWMAPELWQRHFTEGKGDELFRFRRCDVYSLGLIFFYIASDGIKPPEEGMGNTTFDNKLINDDFTLIDLLNKMTSKTPTDRYQTDGVLKHPALWTAENTLIFFSKVSDFLMDKSVDASKLEDPSVINISWKTRVPLNVSEYLFPQSNPTKGRPNYDDKKVKSLLRAVRNIQHHFNELPKDIKGELGDTYEQRLQFWTSRFNRLIIHTYDAMKPYIKKNPEFGQFF